jgi:hypothetical protein
MGFQMAVAWKHCDEELWALMVPLSLLLLPSHSQLSAIVPSASSVDRWNPMEI